MSSGRRGNLASGSRDGDAGTSRPDEENGDDEHSMCIPGLGGPRNQPKPRVLGSSFFGYVADAYSMKTPTMPSERAAELLSCSQAADKSSKTNNPVRLASLLNPKQDSSTNMSC